MFSLSDVDGNFIDFFDTAGEALMFAVEGELANGFRIDGI